MRAKHSRLPARPSWAFVGLVLGALYCAWLTGPAGAQPAVGRPDAARQAAQARLDRLLARINAVEAEASATEAQLRQLKGQEAAQQQTASAARGALISQAVAVYKYGGVDPTLSMLASGSPWEAARRMELLSILAHRNRAELELASSARVRTRATAAQVAQTTGALRARQKELAKLRKQIEAQLAQAEQGERTAGGVAAPRVGGGAAGAAARVIGSIACPVGTPRHYTDTYGAPRSGGRRHKGVDILAPRGTPLYAYESGTIARMNGNSLGGISLYLNGSSGNLYYYTHLRGYVNGLRAGQRVSPGQHIGFTGDTGNARGIPHLHFEVRPGGGANVNPYPYARRACG